MGLTILGLCACGNSVFRTADGGTAATPPEDGSDGPVITLRPDAGSDADAADGMSLQVSDAEAGGDVAPGTLAVAGHAVALTGDGSQTTPLAFTHVALLDAAGTLTNVTTDAAGGFAVQDVAPPFDAVVFPQADDLVDGPNAYIGLSTPHPRLEGTAEVTGGGTASSQHGGYLRVPLQLGACGATTCELETLIAGAVPGGFLYSSNNSPVAYSTSTPTVYVDAQWLGPSIAATINFDFLEADPSFQHFWVASGSAGFADTVTSDYNILTLSPVATLGNVTVTATATGMARSWGAPTTTLSLNYPDNGPAASLAQVQSTSIVSGVPDIVGATLSASSCSQTPSGVLPGENACGKAYDLPLSTATIALTMDALVVTSPQSGATLASTGSLAWSTMAKGQVYDVALVWSPSDGGVVQRSYVILFTSGTSIDIARLVKLGAAPPLGPVTLNISGNGQVASLDAMVDEQTLATSDMTSLSDVFGLAFTLGP